MSNENEIKKLNEAFGSYREEWLKNKVYEFFMEPSYFVALKDGRPCVLQGGRGTGKTTVLWGLSYKGQYNLYNQDLSKFDSNHFIGIYQRIDTSHVRAFKGKGIVEERWQALFGHFFNLIICNKIVKFLIWHNSLSNCDELFTSDVCVLISQLLYLDKKANNLNKLSQSLDRSLNQFQAKINNVSLLNDTLVSAAASPIQLMVTEVLKLKQYQGKTFYFLIDEYENLLDYQQMLINTLIKHTPMNYTFKIGVRELGWRIKNTINENESLIDPSDYVLFNIEKRLTEDSKFPEFARNVCQKRLESLYSGTQEEFNFAESLVSFSMEEEAEKLDIKNTSYIKAYTELEKQYYDKVKDLPLLYQFLISYWGCFHMMDLRDTIEDYELNKKQWDQRYENYKYSLLFKIKKGRGAVGIQKYYAGWKTFLKLSNGNIRYLMELVSKSYERHLNQGHSLFEPVSPEDQTIAAQAVGQKNIEELEGLWQNGAKITRLLYGLGRIFNLLSREEGKVRPEVNQFSVEGILEGECKDIMDAAIMNLALIRMTGNKMSELESTKSFIYSIHPIYAPFFVFSYRRKRKMELTQKDFLDVIYDQHNAIIHLLKTHKTEIDKPEKTAQLSLFEDNDD